MSGCQYDPYASEFAEIEPAAESVVGVYVPDPRTKKLIAETGGYVKTDSAVQLMADGTVVFQSIPDWWNTSFGRPKGGFDSGEGTWKVSKMQRWWGVALLFDSTAAFSSMESPGGLDTGIMLVGNEPPYKLHFTVGDPDSGAAMQFERAAGPKQLDGAPSP
ncbi:MAG TPA: hypothetical protein DCR55_18130 [Lentisphaeria bacterium]|nr:hypothetical protein [Lentisphaeria bacterium]